MQCTALIDRGSTDLYSTGHVRAYQCQCNCFVWSGNALAAFKSKTGALQMEQVLALNVLHAFQKVTAKLFWKKISLKY